jgi:hypothetical protein
MLQASLLLEPESYETHYNLALAYNQLAAQWLAKEKAREAGECFKLAQQYFNNASQLEATAAALGGRAARPAAGLNANNEDFYCEEHDSHIDS